MKDGFVKVAAGTPKIKVADCAHNAGEIVGLMKQAAQQGVKVLVLPELCLTGATCGDLFLQDTLLDGAVAALKRILAETAGLDLVAAVGMPVRGSWNNRVYNCAALISRGEVLMFVPKTRLSTAESRWFCADVAAAGNVALWDSHVMLSHRGILSCNQLSALTVSVVIGEDVTETGAQNAALVLNPAASPALAGRGKYRRDQLTARSGQLMCACVRANAGEGESTTDLVFDGHHVIVENGEVLAENRFGTGLTVSEIDVGLILQERRRSGFEPAPLSEDHWRRFFKLELGHTALTRPIPANPFLPAQGERQYFEEILTIAALGLKKRLEHTRAATAVIGLSGGLDSTLAILTTARAFDMLGRDRKGIVAVTMPCFGTTTRTRSNAELLAEELGTDFRTVDISAAVRQHFADIGHDMSDHSVTFENGQARERTQVLMDIANQVGGLVIGTGDLSELALGWCTYNGDHMSMYAVNGGIPKTLMRHLVSYEAEQTGGKLAAVLRDILDTPVSPELLPPKDGEIAQRTEDLVGPYELHDFFLYYAVGRGFSPRKVLRLAEYALGGSYDRATILKWLNNFYRRFFSQQFKRSCMPDGPKVGALSLSPRGDWAMPSDAVAALWLAELEGLA